jgi:DNA topoisomerase I
VALHPDRLRRHLARDQHRLYELIWQRFVAGQMAAAVFDTTTIDFDILGNTSRRYLFRATGSILKFDGFTRLYREAREEGEHRTLDEMEPLPAVDKGDTCTLIALLPAQHFTQPPPRFTEASLVKELERLGIGRPSTYAQIISTLVQREYVRIEEKRFEPTPLGETVAKVLVRVFPDLFNVSFTSAMETELDRIEEGSQDWRKVLADFYGPFQHQLRQGTAHGEEIVREVVLDEAEQCPECGRDMFVRWSRSGRFLACSGYPECRFTRPIDSKPAQQAQPLGEPCPQCNAELIQRMGRYGPFIACSNYPKCKYTRPVIIPGLVCPSCGTGGIAEKKTRQGKTFWGCTRYPECKWVSWDRPVPGPCPDCNSPFLLAKSTKARGQFLKCPGCKGEFAPDSLAET